MARGRMLSKSLGASRKFAATGKVVVPVEARAAEFPQLLYNLLVPHSDDFGRQPGDAFTVKHVVFPTSPRPESDFEAALLVLERTEMIARYQSNGRSVLQIQRFDEHQQGLRRRTASEFPGPDGDSLDASEADMESLVEASLLCGEMLFHPFTIASVDRQVRMGSLWIDLVARSTDGTVIVIEVKRQKVTDAAIRQVLRYRDLFSPPAIPVVMGHGIATGLDISDRGVLVVTYDDRRAFRQEQGLNVPECSGTFRHVPAEVNRSEVKGTLLSTYSGASAPLFDHADDQKKEPASIWKRALAIAHCVIDAFPDHAENWSHETKERLQLQHMDPRQRSPRGGQLFNDAVEYAIQQRKERGERTGGRRAVRRVG